MLIINIHFLGSIARVNGLRHPRHFRQSGIIEEARKHRQFVQNQED